MNIKQFAEKEGLDETVPSLLLTFPECSPVVLGGLVGQLGEFGTYWYLTTVKEYRKKLNLKGFAPVDVNAIKEISELDHEKFLELYANGLTEFLINEKSSFPIRYTEWIKSEKFSFARANPTSPGGTIIPPSLAKRRFERTSIEDKHMDPNQLASFRNVVDRVVSDIMLIYEQFLNDPSKPVALQKRLGNFAGKQDRVKLVLTIAKPLPFALVNKETDTVEVTNDVPELDSSRIKLGALKLFCLETIAGLGRKLGLEERPDAVVDGFNLSSIRLRDRFTDSYQVASLQWYIPVSKAAAIYFQIEIRVPSPVPSPFFDNALFRQTPKYKEL